MKNIFLLPILLVALFCSCNDDAELSKSEYISDLYYTDLPQYSEWGYNTFGVYFDRQAFVSTDEDIPLKVIVTDGETIFKFKGQKNDGPMTMSIVLSSFAPSAYSGLNTLNDTTIDLTDSLCRVALNIDNIEYNPTVMSGSIEFKKAQNLIVDGVQTEVILSGYFEMQVRINEEPFSLTNGRFDMGISESNFFNY